MDGRDVWVASINHLFFKEVKKKELGWKMVFNADVEPVFLAPKSSRALPL